MVQISFRLYETQPVDVEVYKRLNDKSVFPQGPNQAAKDIVTTFIKQAADHPGCSVYAAQNHYIVDPSLDVELPPMPTAQMPPVKPPKTLEMPTIDSVEPMDSSLPPSIEFDMS